MDIVITTILPPTQGTRQITEGLAIREGTLWVVGDRRGPTAYPLSHTQFHNLESQRRLGFKLARELPENHYTRKNLGYLLAVQSGAEVLLETDDDNLPLPGFWTNRIPLLVARNVQVGGWFNAYSAFTPHKIWPRGFPLEMVNVPTAVLSNELVPAECLIQQGLANQNPDVDAVYRLTMPLPIDFTDGPPLALGPGCWCPFNSQNTTFFKPAFPLLYLPSRCTFRMTDIWRSFVAQRCLWEMDSRLGFTGPTMFQERNAHRLLSDFEQEIPGYLYNHRIREVLEALPLQRGRARATVCANLRLCYEALAGQGFLAGDELSLVDAWITDVSALP